MNAVKAMILDDNAQETHGVEKLRLLTGTGNVLTEQWLKNQAWQRLFAVTMKDCNHSLLKLWTTLLKYSGEVGQGKTCSCASEACMSKFADQIPKGKSRDPQETARRAAILTSLTIWYSQYGISVLCNANSYCQ